MCSPITQLNDEHKNKQNILCQTPKKYSALFLCQVDVKNWDINETFEYHNDFLTCNCLAGVRKEVRFSRKNGGNA